MCVGVINGGIKGLKALSQGAKDALILKDLKLFIFLLERLKPMALYTNADGLGGWECVAFPLLSGGSRGCRIFAYFQLGGVHCV